MVWKFCSEMKSVSHCTRFWVVDLNLYILCGMFMTPIADAYSDQTKVFTGVRLVGGTNEGIVEVLTPLGWFPVCWNYQWTQSRNVPVVLCRQLGYNGIAGISYSSSSEHFRYAKYRISCKGNEESLSHCFQEFQRLTSYCGLVNVTCSPCQANSVRLRGGLIPEQGNVELCINGGWTGVCGGYSNWNSRDAFVVCRQLGFPVTDATPYYSTEFVSPQYYDTSLRKICYNCFGNESLLTNCLLNTSCSNYCNVAGVNCRGQVVGLEGCRDNDIRLSGGRDQFEGRIEVCSNDVWGTVFGGGYWNKNDATVVCRQFLGSSGRLRNLFSSSATEHLFGLGSGPVVLSRLYCNGTETTLQQCQQDQYYNYRATHFYGDVGVRCEPNFTASNKTANCADGDVRLADGSTPYEGRVEMCYNGFWGPVCDFLWDNNDASVVCHQLGFQGANATATYDSYYGESLESSYYVLSDVRCNGHERNLTECVDNKYLGYVSENCLSGNDAGVRCDDSQCNHGDVRLFGGYSDRDGVTEVCINGYWGDICDDDWDRDDATVFCRQLFGENTLTLHSSCCTQRRSTGNFTLANLDCSLGNPNRIVDCSYTLVEGSSSSAGCNEESIVGCFEWNVCSTGDVRLVNGSTTSDGRVEVCLNNTWGTLPSRGWSLEEAEVTCRQLGLPLDWSLPVENSIYGYGNSRFESCVYDSTLRGNRGFCWCRGTEQSLTNCDWRPPTQFTLERRSNSYASAGVICQGIVDSSTVCEENDTRLVNGTNEMDGRVEICAYRTWVTMCDIKWSIEETQTVCKHLGYPVEGSFHIPSSPFGVDYSLPIAGRLTCTSETTNVGECQLTNRTSGCHYGRSIGVVCKERTYYNISIEAPRGPFEVGSVFQLNCSVTPQPDTRAALLYQWRSSTSFPGQFIPVQNITVETSVYYPSELVYYCHVYSGGAFLGSKRITLSVKELLHAIVPTSIMAPISETVTLQVNTTDHAYERSYILRELAWYHNGQRLIPNEHMLLREDNKTLTILNTTDEDNGVYEAMFEGLLVYPHNRYCERVYVNLLRHYPILKPVVFHINCKENNVLKIRNVQGIGFPTFPPGVMIPVTNGDNVTLTASGYIAKSQELDEAHIYWLKNGQQFYSHSSLHISPAKADYLNVSQSFSLSSIDFNDAGVYEVQLSVNQNNSFFLHDQCWPYYFHTFVETANHFGTTYIILSQAEVHLPYVDMLSFSLDVDKPSITQEESATITCSASIKYPPLTSISLLKDDVQLAITSDEMLQLNTRDVSTNVFGVYVCVIDASGVVLQKEILLKEKGCLHLELDVIHCSKNMTDLQSLASKVQNECSCYFTDSEEASSANSSRLSENCADSFTDSEGAVYVPSAGPGGATIAGAFTGGLLTGILLLCIIATIIIIIRMIILKNKDKKSFDAASNPRHPTSSHSEDRYVSQVIIKAPKQPMVSTKPNRAYIKQAPKEREVEQELYEDVDMGANGGGEAINEETM